jgi:hypothetical protein
MPALVAGIHVFFLSTLKDVDGRDKPGHDDGEAVTLQRPYNFTRFPSSAAQ